MAAVKPSRMTTNRITALSDARTLLASVAITPAPKTRIGSTAPTAPGRAPKTKPRMPASSTSSREAGAAEPPASASSRIRSPSEIAPHATGSTNGRSSDTRRRLVRACLGLRCRRGRGAGRHAARLLVVDPHPSRLRSLVPRDHAAALQHVDQPAGAGVADAQAPLQQGDRCRLVLRDAQDRLVEQRVLVGVELLRLDVRQVTE